MSTKPPDASHFLAELEASEKWTETYKWYVEETAQLSDNAMQKERQQSLKLCLKAGWRAEEYIG